MRYHIADNMYHVYPQTQTNNTRVFIEYKFP